MVVLERRDRPGIVDKAGVPLTMRTPQILATYAFRGMTGSPAVGDRIPDTAPVLDSAPACEVGDDGMLRMLMPDGTTTVAGRARGKDATLPSTMSGEATTLATGKASLDWSVLKLKAAPSRVDVWPIGRSAKLSLDAIPTATGVVVSAEEDKPQAVVGISVNLAAAGGRPAAGVRLWWTVTA